MLLYFALLCFCILKNERAAASKGKATIAAVPKGKKGRKSSGFSFGLMNRLIREAKVAFSSGLEALTLQVSLVFACSIYNYLHENTTTLDD